MKIVNNTSAPENRGIEGEKKVYLYNGLFCTCYKSF